MKKLNFIQEKKEVCCIVCNKTEYEVNSSIGNRFCSWSCYDKYKQINTKPNVKCEICEKEFYLKPSRIKRVKHGVVCSNECKKKLKSIIMSGEGNHQFGLTGDKNASFKGKEIINQYGYIMEYVPNHPKADVDGRYRQHRLIIEQCLEIDESFFEYIKGTRVLKDEYIIHHLDENKRNNNLENLCVLTKSEHTSHHNKDKYLIRDDKGRIIGVLKSDKLLENLEEDNQQPI